MVSLPKAWVDSNGLEKNDEVELEAEGGWVTVAARPRGRPHREVVIPYPLPPEENIAADLTGAYLLGYDSIRIRGSPAIPSAEREKVRSLMRRLVGMEIVEEDSAEISAQFLLDASAISPQKTLRRMGHIVLGMYSDASAWLLGPGAAAPARRRRPDLLAVAGRDEEVNRQYFLLVRLTRSATIDRRLAGAFGLEGIDVLDYRVAANLLEGAGDAVVELAGSAGAPRAHRKKVHAAASRLGSVGAKAVEAFVSRDRKLAIEAIAQHRAFEEALRSAKASLGGGPDVPIGYLDTVYLLERTGRAWADIADLVQPVYSR